jgi:hypothetical protein
VGVKGGDQELLARRLLAVQLEASYSEGYWLYIAGVRGKGGWSVRAGV